MPLGVLFSGEQLIKPYDTVGARGWKKSTNIRLRVKKGAPVSTLAQGVRH